LLHDLDLSDEFDTVVVILGEALYAFDGHYETSVAALSLNDSSEGAFTDLFDNIVILSNFHPVLRKTEAFECFFLVMIRNYVCSCIKNVSFKGLDFIKQLI
jgi:hypothetical protein